MRPARAAPQIARPQRPDRSRARLVGKKNGELMRLIAAHGFDVLLSVDQNMQFQQHLKSANFAVIVQKASTNRFTDLLPLVPQVLAAIANIQPGDLIEVNP
jgi:hypothetical protein